MFAAPGAVNHVGLFTGRHVLCELEGVDFELLNDEAYLRQILERSLVQAGATILEVSSKHFEPQGVTVLVLLSESHASMHTYPEIGSVFIDVFTCGDQASPELAVRLLAQELQAPGVRTQIIRRGKNYS
jgi:S-adenosylmethionine decarboxylase